MGCPTAAHDEVVAVFVVRNGPAATAIPRVISDCEASALYFNADVTPFSTARDQAIGESVTMPVHAFDGLTGHEPGAVLTKKGTRALLGAPAIHEPSAADSADLDAAGITLGETYPLPIVDHGKARLRTLETYKRALK